MRWYNFKMVPLACLKCYIHNVPSTRLTPNMKNCTLTSANLQFQISWYNKITSLPPLTQHHGFFRNLFLYLYANMQWILEKIWFCNFHFLFSFSKKFIFFNLYTNYCACFDKKQIMSNILLFYTHVHIIMLTSTR